MRKTKTSKNHHFWLGRTLCSIRVALLLVLPVLLLLGTERVAFGFVIGVVAPTVHQRSSTASCFALTMMMPNDDEQQHETLSSLSIQLTDFVVRQQQQQKQQKQSSSEENDDVTEEELLRLGLLYTRLDGLKLNRTHVGPSQISGRGLFASCDCAKGDLLTCYPGDALVIIPDDEDWTILWSEHVGKAYDIDLFLENIVHVYDDYGIVGLPFLDQDPAYLGHFANDGVANIPTCEADCDTYVIESNRLANAMHDDLDESHMVTIATKDIVQGEEIFVTYGPEYWMEQPTFERT